MDANIFAGYELPSVSAAAASADVGDGAAGGVRSRFRRIGSVVLRRGWALGKKLAVAGAVGPPVVLLSALGMALSLPFGLYLASLAGTEKLMSCLLPFSPEEDEEDSFDPEEEQEEVKEWEGRLSMEEQHLVQELGFREGIGGVEDSVDHENGGSSSQSSTNYEHPLGVSENVDHLQTMPEDNCTQSTETTQLQIQLPATLVEDEELNWGIEMEKEKVKSEGVLETGKSNKDDDFDGTLTKHPFADEKRSSATIEDDTVESKVQEHVLSEELYIEEIKGLAEEKAEGVIVHGLQSVCVLDEGSNQLKCMEDETEVDAEEGIERNEHIELIQSDSTGVSQKEAIEKEEKGLELIKDNSVEMQIKDELGTVEKKTEEQRSVVAIHHNKLPLFCDTESMEDESRLGTMGDSVRDNEVIPEEDEKKEIEKLTVFIDDYSMDRRIKDSNSEMEERNEDGIKGLVEKSIEKKSTYAAIYDLQPEIHVLEEHDSKFNNTENEDFGDARGYIQTNEKIELPIECISIGERKEEDVRKEEEHLTSDVIKNDISDSKLQDDSVAEKGMLFEGMQVKKLGGQKLEQSSSATICELQPIVYALEGHNNQVKNCDGKSSVDVKGDNQRDEEIKGEGSIEEVDYAGGREVEATVIKEEAMSAAFCGYEKSFVAPATKEGEVEISLSGLNSEDSTMNYLKSDFVNVFQEKQSAIEIKKINKIDIAEQRIEWMHPNIVESENLDPLGNDVASANTLSETTVETQQGIFRMDESLELKQITEEGNMVKKIPIEVTETHMTERNVLIVEPNEVASDTPPGPEKAQKSKEDFNENDYMDAQFKVSKQNQSSLISDHPSAIKDKSLWNTDNASLSSKELLLDQNTRMVVVTPFPSSSNEVLYTEEILWEQIHAMRTIIGYKGVMRSALVEELKALYLFTGIEPPDVFRDNSDLLDLAVKLQFLKAVIGIE